MFSRFAMLRYFLMFCLIFLVCPLFAAIDSAATVTGINLAGKLAEVIANLTGHSGTGQLITLVLAAVVPIVSFIFGHAHGKKSAMK
jgi:hypothetical protein